MFKLVVAIFCAVAPLVRFGEATSKIEVATWIDKATYLARREEVSRLSEVAREILAKSTSQDQTKCVKRELPKVHDEIDTIVKRGANSIKMEYMIMAEEKFMALRYDEIVKHIQERFSGIKPYVEEVLKKIKKCV